MAAFSSGNTDAQGARPDNQLATHIRPLEPLARFTSQFCDVIPPFTRSRQHCCDHSTDLHQFPTAKFHIAWPKTFLAECWKLVNGLDRRVWSCSFDAESIFFTRKGGWPAESRPFFIVLPLALIYHRDLVLSEAGCDCLEEPMNSADAEVVHHRGEGLPDQL